MYKYSKNARVPDKYKGLYNRDATKVERQPHQTTPYFLPFFGRFLLPFHDIRANKIAVWCGLQAGGVIGPYFFRDDQDRHVTVNRYRSMITEYFWHQLDDMDLKDMWFQQDGATSPTANVTINLLASKFGERVISGNGRLGRTIDCFLWGYVKSMLCDNE